MKYLKIFLVTGLLISFFLYCAYLHLSSFERFIKYLKNNPDKFSLVATVDDKLVYQNNGEKLFYIASTKKILILVELAS